MSEIPANLKYTDSHEWIDIQSNNQVIVGITDHAQQALGDMVYIELPEVGIHYDIKDECAVVESVKAASDIYVPLSGKIIEINSDLEDSPDLLNRFPYGDGWLFKMQLEGESELEELLDAEGYSSFLEENAD